MPILKQLRANPYSILNLRNSSLVHYLKIIYATDFFAHTAIFTIRISNLGFFCNSFHILVIVYLQSNCHLFSIFTLKNSVPLLRCAQPPDFAWPHPSQAPACLVAPPLLSACHFCTSVCMRALCC